jgi:hypothetical protein
MSLHGVLCLPDIDRHENLIRPFLIQGIEEVRRLIAGEQGSKVWLVFLLPSGEPGDLLLDVKVFDRWRAVELTRNRPFTATNNLWSTYRAVTRAARSMRHGDMDETAFDKSLDQAQEWPESSATLSKALSGRTAELEVFHVDMHPDADGTRRSFKRTSLPTEQ